MLKTVCIIFLALSVCLKAESIKTVLYSETAGVGITLNKTLTTTNDTITVLVSNNIETITTKMDKSYNAIETKWVCPSKFANIHAKREDNNIIFTGTHNNNEVSFTTTIDNDAWHQNIETGLKHFIKSKNTRHLFWAIRPKDLKLIKFMVTKVKEEPITVQGKTVNALNVRMQLTGLMALLWNAHYWFNPETGEFYKFEGANGPPGTPPTTIIKVE